MLSPIEQVEAFNMYEAFQKLGFDLRLVGDITFNLMREPCGGLPSIADVLQKLEELGVKGKRPLSSSTAGSSSAASSSAPLAASRAGGDAKQRLSLIRVRCCKIDGESPFDPFMPLPELLNAIRRSVVGFAADIPSQIRAAFGTIIRIDPKQPLDSILKQFIAIPPDILQRQIIRLDDGRDAVDVGGVLRSYLTHIADVINQGSKSIGFSFLVCKELSSVCFPPPDAIEESTWLVLEALGRILAFALLNEIPFPVRLALSLFKVILGQDLSFADLEEIDPKMFRGMQQVAQFADSGQDVSDLCLEGKIVLGSGKIDVLPGGVEVTNENVLDYLSNYTKLLLGSGVPLDALAAGFSAVVPRHFIKNLSPVQLSLLCCGANKVDIDDMRRNINFKGFTQSPAHQQLRLWFWNIIRDFNQTLLGQFLCFVTGSPVPPVGGFGSLSPKITVKLTTASPQSLPLAHSCFNQLDLPEYPSLEVFRAKFVQAITENGAADFGFA